MKNIKLAGGDPGTRTVVKAGSASIGRGFAVIAGPCAVESEEQTVTTARAVQARMANLAHPELELEDTLDALIRFDSGVVASVTASTALWPGADVRIEVYGEKGAAVMKGAALSLWQFQEELPDDEAIRHSGDAAQATAASDPTALPSEEHQMVIDDCVDAIREDREVAIPCHSVRPTLELALAMYKSARLGEKPVNLPMEDERDVWG
jgi:predicted dehydrogenase